MGQKVGWRFHSLLTNLKLAEPESRSLFGMLHDFVTRKPIDLPFCLVDASLSSIYSILFHWYTTSLASCSKAKAVIPEYTQNSNGARRGGLQVRLLVAPLPACFLC